MGHEFEPRIAQKLQTNRVTLKLTVFLSRFGEQDVKAMNSIRLHITKVNEFKGEIVIKIVVVDKSLVCTFIIKRYLNRGKL